GRDVELATELGHRLLARHDPLDRCPLELRGEHPPAVCLPPMLAHGTPDRILRPHGEQSKRGALHSEYRLVLLLLAVVLGVAVWLVMQRTQIGIVARAVIMNEELAQALGIHTRL